MKVSTFISILSHRRIKHRSNTTDLNEEKKICQTPVMCTPRVFFTCDNEHTGVGVL